MKKLNKVVVYVFIFSFFSCNTQTQSIKMNTVFSTDLWISDTLGSKGYRSEIIQKTDFLENLVGKSQKTIEILLGSPDFICKSQKEISYHYNFEYTIFLGHRKYEYKPRQDCGKNANLGSFLSIMFNESGQVYILPLIVYKGG